MLIYGSLFHFQVKHSVYPYRPDLATTQDKILLEVEYIVNKLRLDARRHSSSDSEEVTEEEVEEGNNRVNDNDQNFDIVEGQFDDADEDDIGCAFLNSSHSETLWSRTYDDVNVANTKLYEEENGNVMFEVPLLRLMEFDCLQKICTSVDLLRYVYSRVEGNIHRCSKYLPSNCSSIKATAVYLLNAYIFMFKDACSEIFGK